VIVKYHDRISSLHLKDRSSPTPDGPGANMPWGKGSTPLKDVLQTMKKNKYKFPGSIEYEYNTPEGSDVLTEVKKCVQYCKEALA
jgi:sugar phosphate isomerase/epimerase